MKKIYLFYIFIFTVLFSGCSHDNNIIKKENIITGSGIVSGGVSGINSMGGHKTMTGTIQSGLFIDTTSGNIILSGKVLGYKDSFKISLDKKIHNAWEYFLGSRVSDGGEVEKLRINDIYSYGMNIYTNIFYSNYNSIKDICTPDYQEGINHKPKTLELKKGNQIYYLTYAVFDITSPDTVPSKNYNADICFVKENKIYRISIGNPTQYRKDIVDSLTFL